jgi:hypothetical protein
MVVKGVGFEDVRHGGWGWRSLLESGLLRCAGVVLHLFWAVMPHACVGR